MNKVILIGNITKDLELRFTPNGKEVTSFTVAINEGRDKVEFIDCEAWGKTAINVTDYLKKGSKCAVEGSLKTERWKDKDTDKDRSRVKVLAWRVEFMDSKKDREQTEFAPEVKELEDAMKSGTDPF